jgi:hypothetical protein
MPTEESFKVIQRDLDGQLLFCQPNVANLSVPLHGFQFQ